MKKVKTNDIENILKHTSKTDLQPVLDSFTEDSFTSEFNRLLYAINLSKSELIKKTTLDRNYAYQIIQGTKKASKDKVIQLGLALSCSLDEINRLLKLSNNSILYAKNKRDILIIVAFETKLSVMETNDLLNSHQFEVL